MCRVKRPNWEDPFHHLENIKKKVSNPFNFSGAPMVTTFVRSAGSRTQGVGKFLEKASQIDAGVRPAELKHPSLKKMSSYCTGRVPIYVYPSFYRVLKVRFPMDVGGVPGIATELGTGSLTVGILIPEDFRTIVDTEKVSGSE